MRERIARVRVYVTGSGLGPFVIRSLAGSGIVRIAAMVASFGVGVQLAHMLGVTGYGYYGLALAVIAIAGIPGELGVTGLVTREVAAAAALNDAPKLFGVLRWADKIAWQISALTGFAVLVGSVVAATARPSALASALLLGAPTIPFMALARIRGGSLQGLRYIVLGQIPANLLRPLLLSILLLLIGVAGRSIGAPGAMALNSITAAAVFFLAHIWLQQRLPKERPADLVRTGSRWIASLIPMALTDGMRLLQAELSTLLLGIIATPADVGLFRIAIVTATAAATAIPVVNTVALPVIARLFAEKEGMRLQETVTRLAQAQTLGVLLLTLPLFVAAEPLIRLVFGADFVPSANAVRIVAAAQLVNAAFGPNVAMLNMTNHERRVTRAMAIALLVNIVAVAALAAYAGLSGAAVGVFLAFIVWNVVTWWDARCLLGIDTSILPPRNLTPLVGRDESLGRARPELVKPNLFIVGAPKCGTTAWFEYLGTHPDVFVPEVKEPHYFAADMPGKRWTRSLAQYERLFQGAGNAKIAGEASVMYLYSTAAAALIREFSPRAKILIFLRRQEDFLPSLHHQFVFSFAEDIDDFGTAWRLSGKRPPESIPNTCPDPRLLDYAAMGRFHEQVARYFELFPREQIKVIHFDEWTSDPRSTYLGILDFLGLKDDGRADFPRINEAKAFRVKWLGKLITHPPRILRAGVWLPRKITGHEVLGLADWASNLLSTRGYRTHVSPDLRAEIRTFYEEDNRQLAALLANATARSVG